MTTQQVSDLIFDKKQGMSALDIFNQMKKSDSTLTWIEVKRMYNEL